MEFKDRYHAAILLAEKLKSFGAVNPLIAAIPRGAVEMAEVIASPELGLGGDLDVILVHKFTSPENPEFALGSVTEDGDIYFNDDAKASGYLLGLDEDDLISAANAEIEKLQLKRQRYTPHRAGLGMKDRTVIIVDDGIATGATMMAAIKSAFSKGAHHVIAAAPMATHEAIQRLKQTGAEVCTFAVSEGFFSVSQFYDDFSQVSDAAVAEILARHEPEVLIRSHGVSLRGYLNIPPYCRGLVLFAHGAGSGRNSPRNQFVANSLQRAGIGTLLVDLLQIGEGGDGEKDADISFLTERLLVITDWIKKNPKISHFPLGLFGASTGAASTLRASVELGDRVSAVVLRGGRPDLAWESLAQVTAPTLVIVGGDDEPVLAINHEAFSQLNCVSDLVVIPGATHLFDEPGALEQVAQRTREWFLRFFSEGVSEKEEMRRPRPRENSRPLSGLY
jgi:putative phosphoribosyl transferase